MRGDYDYHHSTAGTQHVVTIVIVIFSMMVLAGLFIGLNVLDHL